jgi:hypothetical protein
MFLDRGKIKLNRKKGLQQQEREESGRGGEDYNMGGGGGKIDTR